MNVNQIGIAIISLLWVVTIGGQTAHGDATITQSQYDLTIGDKTYSVVPDQPFTISGPDGTQIPALLRSKRELVYHNFGISFTYPQDVRVSSDKSEGLETVTADTPGNYTMIMLILPGFVSPNDMKSGLEPAMVTKYKSMGAKFSKSPPKPVVRTMGSRQLSGSKNAFTLNGEDYRYETYTFALGDQTFALLLVYTLDELKDSEHATSMILGSLKTDAAK